MPLGNAPAFVNRVEEPTAELQRVRALVMRHGWNATAYQIINPGIFHWFSRRHDAVVGYVKFHHTRVVAGAPVCREEDLREVYSEFERDSGMAGFAVCYFGAESRLENLLRSSPTHSLVLLGAQPSFDPAEWSELIAQHASLREQLNRARNKKVEVIEYDALRASEDPRLRDCLREWLSTRGLPPLHFLVEPQTLTRLFDRRVFVAERSGTPVGFLVASPIPQRNGWLIEQIVRGRAAPNGASELLLDTAMRAFAAENGSFATLGLSPLSERAGATLQSNPLWLRLILAWLRAHGSRFYNFGGLDRFKAKFRPRSWDPIFAISNEAAFTPATLYAIAGAFTNGHPFIEGFRALARAVLQETGWQS